jgi:hypothetical protein
MIDLECKQELTVNDTKNLIEVTSSGRRVREHEADDLLRVDHKYCADSEREALGIDVGGIEGVEHVVKRRDLPVLIRDLVKS